MSPRRFTPTDAVRTQDSLVRFWKSSRGPDFFQGWAEVRRRDGAPVYIPVPEHRAHFEVLTLAGARTYFVTEDMTALVQHAAQTMPDEPLLETDLPTPNGFVMLERVVVFPDVRGNNVALSAFAWRRIIVEGKVALYWSFYADVEDERDDYGRMRDASPQAKAVVRRAFVPEAVLLAEDLEVFGEPHATAEEIVGHYPHAASVETVRLTLSMMADFPRALFSLLNSSVTVLDEARAARSERRRLERSASPVTGDIVVVRLRRARHESAPAGESAVEWSHRWIVSGHWRNAWRPSVGAHRRVWVAPFVKGPEDRPLVVTRKVHVLER